MKTSDWQRMWTVFDAALDRAEESARRRYVHEAADGDADLEKEVLALLDAHQLGGVLDNTASLFSVPSYQADDKETDDTPIVPPVGSRIGPYELLDEVGRGGMGIVFKARDERLDRMVALKMLPYHLGADPSAKSRFVAEARAAAGLEHPNIATIYDIGEAPDGRLYIAMAFYAGETLFERIAKGPLPLDSAVDIALQIAAGLSRAHAKNIVHRDIKPANILLTTGGEVKILDFGIAKMPTTALTKSGETIGTAAYMSPEQAGGRDVDHRSDLWSLGIVLYEMMTGRRPFDADHQSAVMYSILHDDPSSPRNIRPDVAPALCEVTLRLLRRNPEERFASADEAASALEDAVRNPNRTDGTGRSHHAPLASTPERMRATVLVSKLHGYSALLEHLVPEELQFMTENIRSKLDELLDALDGLTYRFDGDTLIALFGIPEAHEDDFVRAVRAGRSIHAQLSIVSDELHTRTRCRLNPSSGIDTGMLVVRMRDGALDVTGDALQNATQLSLQAGVDDILISSECERLVRPFFETEPAPPLRMHGRDAGITPFRVAAETGLKTRLEASEKAGLTPYSGRQKELDEIESAYMHARKGDGRFVTVVGEAGLGKSRLLYEFCRNVEQDRDVAIVKGRCQSYGGKVAYLPFIELLRQYFGISGEMSSDEMERAVVDSVLAIDEGLGVFIPLYLHVLSIHSSERPLPGHLEGEDLRMATVEALAGVITLGARRNPAVVLLEDWHWSDDASQDVLKQVAELTSSYPLLVVVTFRPEKDSGRTYDGHHSQIHLTPLDEASSAAIIRSVLDAPTVVEAFTSLLHERTGGNPFFLEEICRTLLEEGALEITAGRAVPKQSLDALNLPDTVQAVIRSRIHRLDYGVRKVLRVAAVVGREFSRQVLSEVLSDQADLREALTTLRDLGLIQQIRVFPEAVYRFKHVLTQDVAYDSLLQHQRKALHHQVGDAVERLFQDRRDEHLDLLVHHFARAEDWHRAAIYGEQSARRAIRMSQFPEAAAMLHDVRKWLQRLPDKVRRREQVVSVLLEHERVCETIGDRAEQQRIIDELLELLATGQDAVTLAEVYRRQGDLHVLRRRLADAEQALDKALALAKSAEDREVERRTLRSFGFLRWRQDRSDDALAINETLLNLHVECGDDRAVVGDLVNLCIIKRDLGDYDGALAYLQQSEELLEGLNNPSVEAYIAHSLGTIYQLRDQNEEALPHFEHARSIAEKQRLPLQLSFSMMSVAHIKLKLGRVEESIEYYQNAIELTRRSRYADGLAKSLLVFGDILYGLGRYDDSLTYLEEAADWLGRLEDATSEAEALKKIAAIYGSKNQLAEAEAAWRRITDLLDALDVGYEIDALEAFAGLARRRGDDTEALAHYDDAIERSVQTGDMAREARLRNSAGILAWQRGENEDALQHYERAHALFMESGDGEGTGLMLNSIGLTLHTLGRTDDALQQLRSAVENHRAHGRKQLEAHALAVIGDIQAERDEFDSALASYAHSLQLRWDLNDRLGEGWMLHHMAAIHAAQGEPDRAGEYERQSALIATERSSDRLLEACRAVREEIRMHVG